MDGAIKALISLQSSYSYILIHSVMKMEVEIISTTNIAPSSPTPSHLKTYKISLLDQFEPSTYIGAVLFFQNSHETNIITPERSLLLKQSLSENLSCFYPIAGRVKDKFSIDCNDEGVSYIEAKTNIPLSQYLAKPDLTLLHKLMPNSTRDYDLPPGSPVALIQETAFSCGGFAIGMYVSHMLCDGTGLFLFIKDWFAISSKVAVEKPFLGSESIFPQNTSFPKEKSENPASLFLPFLKTGNYVTKRILFSETTIANLRAKLKLEENVTNPSRTEVVTAILSKWLMTSFKSKTGIDGKPLVLCLPVDLRRKVEPPLPARSLGNFLSAAGVLFTEEEDQLSGFIKRLRESFKKVDNDFVKRIRSEEDGFSVYYNALKEIRDLDKSPVFVAFSSLINWGGYGDIEVAGWGKLIWATCLPRHVEDSHIPFMNTIILMNTRAGYGVEAWLSLNQDDFDILEKDIQLLEYVTVDPSPNLELI